MRRLEGTPLPPEAHPEPWALPAKGTASPARRHLAHTHALPCAAWDHVSTGAQGRQKSPRLTEHAGPVAQHPPLLGAVGGGRLLQGLVELAVGRQQGWDPLGLHGRDAWGPGRGAGVTAGRAAREGLVCPPLPGAQRRRSAGPQRARQGAGHQRRDLSCTAWRSLRFPGTPRSRAAL